jgi:hypothetical protein
LHICSPLLKPAKKVAGTFFARTHAPSFTVPEFAVNKRHPEEKMLLSDKEVLQRLDRRPDWEQMKGGEKKGVRNLFRLTPERGHSKQKERFLTPFFQILFSPVPSSLPVA